MQQPLQPFYKRNIPLKIISFIFALLLWVYVSAEGGDQIRTDLVRTYPNVPINWTNVENDLVIKEIPSNADVILRGEGNLLDRVSPTDLNLYVDLAGKGEGVHRIKVSGNTPRGTSIINITPEIVNVVMEEIITSTFNVEISLSGEPAPGYELGEPVLSDTQVFIQGSRSELELVERVYLKIDVEGADREIVKIAPLLAIDDNGELLEDLSLSPETVEIRLPVQRAKKQVTVQVPLAGELSEQFKISNIEIYPKNIFVTGDKEILAETWLIETESIDLSNVTENITKALEVNLPSGIELYEEVFFRVNITIEETETLDAENE